MTKVGHWPLNEWSGRANDLSGNGNHGTVNGATQGVWGKSGLTSYSFDGTDDYINIGDTGLTTNSDFTTTCWFKHDSTTKGYLIGLYDGTDDIFFMSCTGSSPEYRIGHAGGNEISRTISSATYSQYEWNYATLVWDSSDSTAKFYLNAELVDVTSGTVADPFDDTETPNLGRRSDGDKPFNGNISDFRIYDRALSPQEIETLYEWGNIDNTLPSLSDGTDSGAVSRWTFDGDVLDSWGTNDGTDNTSAGYSSDAIREQAKSFDGTDDYVDIPDGVLSTSDTFTLSAWTKLNTTSSSAQYVVNVRGDVKFALYQNNSDWRVYDGSGDYILDNAVPGTWVHIVGRYDGTQTFGYINGVKRVENSTTLDSGTVSNMIGSYDGSSYFFDGLIDDVRIYNRALESWEIAELYRWGTKGVDGRKKLVKR